MPGFKSWAVGEEVLAADFNSYVQTQVVAQFANAAARDAAIVAPVAGMVAYLADAQSLCTYNGSAWVMVGKGRIAYANGTARDATQGLFINAQVSFTLPTSRLIRVDGWVNYQEITAAANSSIYCNLGVDVGRQLQFAATLNLPVNGIGSGIASYVAQVAAGAHTAEVHIANNSTVGAARSLAGPGGSYVAVYDIGGV